jgi:PST family polysaccharide transporter
VLLVSFIAVPGHAMFPDWLFQGIEKMKYITIFSLLMKLVFTILVFVLIKSPDDYLYQPLLIGLGYVVSGVLAMSLIKRMGIKLHRPQFSKIKVALKSNVDLFINQIVPNLYNSLSTILLGFMHGSVANGIFDAGNRFNLVSTQFMNVISRTFFPYLSRKLSKHDMYVRLHLSFSVICAVALFAFAPLIIDIFFSKEYYDAVIVLRIMSLSLIFLSLDNIYGTNYLIVVGEEKTLRNITFISSIIGFACAIPMAYYYSYIGVAIVIVFTRSLMALLITRKALKIKRQND